MYLSIPDHSSLMGRLCFMIYSCITHTYSCLIFPNVKIHEKHVVHFQFYQKAPGLV